MNSKPAAVNDLAPPGMPRLAQVPDVSQTHDLAGLLSDTLAGPLVERSPAAICKALGWRYVVKPVGESTSTVQSVLAPLLVGGFAVVINAHHSRSDDQALWLTLHEVGHSLFYTRGCPPRRIIPSTLAEERFCDRLADEVLA